MTDTEVFRLSFAEDSDIKVEEIHFRNNGTNGVIQVEGPDIVFLNLGSTIACTSVGTNYSPPAPLPSIHDALRAPDSAWGLWSSLFFSSLVNTPQAFQLGNPKNFYSRMEESSSLWFTVTLQNSQFFTLFEKWSSNLPGRGGLTTFKDSSWLMSIIVPHQPCFLNQPDDVQVFWGYALFPEKTGEIIQKPMVECTGQEILTELLGLLNFPENPTLGSATVIPLMMPYITSPLLTRAYEDRPQVIPKASTNLALLGQFVEVPQDSVFPMEYSVRVAQTAVFGMMGVQKQPKDVYKGEKNFMALINALKTLLA
jgi:oleate hydratase